MVPGVVASFTLSYRSLQDQEQLDVSETDPNTNDPCGIFIDSISDKSTSCNNWAISLILAQFQPLGQNKAGVLLTPSSGYLYIIGLYRFLFGTYYMRFLDNSVFKTLFGSPVLPLQELDWRVDYASMPAGNTLVQQTQQLSPAVDLFATDKTRCALVS